MAQMWHPVGLRMALVALLASACSGAEAEREPSSPSVPDESVEDEDEDQSQSDESVLAFEIDGRSEPLGGQAKLEVRQGVPTVHLGITWADGGSDLVVFDLYFAGIESAMGDHVLELGLPDRVDNFANVNLDGEFYYSQGGVIELSLSEDGSIEGRFDMNLAPDETEPGAPPAALVPSDNPMPLAGGFEGSWILNCQSRLPGHETLMSGGAFCESLDF